MNKSKRHHYIPKFITKNFTDSEGLLFVYNKIENRIIKSRQSPKSIFFEIDRNTVDFSGHKLDNLELLYSELDNKISIDIKNIIETKSISPEELTSIAILACQLKWRIPKIDNDFKFLKEDLTKEDLKVEISVRDKHSEIDNKAIEHIENSAIFKESKRILLSILPFIDKHILFEIYNNSFINSNELFPSLIGDCPILEKTNTDIYNFEDFIFPLSSSDTFIFKKGTNKRISNILFYIQRDLAIIESSSKYIGCKSKEHLEKIILTYNRIKDEDKLKNINKHLFKFID